MFTRAVYFIAFLIAVYTYELKELESQNNLNQQEEFTSLLNTLELSNAKSILGSRSNSIEVFQTTVNNLVKFYINSLEENITTEDRIREELSLQLTTKDKTYCRSPK